MSQEQQEYTTIVILEQTGKTMASLSEQDFAELVELASRFRLRISPVGGGAMQISRHGVNKGFLDPYVSLEIARARIVSMGSKF